jgi:hypothetical protein
MSFLTSEEATSLVSGLHGGLGQPWYNKSNVVAGMGGLLYMQELTSLKNYYVDPPDFPASMGGLGNRAVPISDLVPGEYVTGSTLVDHAQRFSGLGSQVPVSDFVPGEIMRAAGSGKAVPVRDFVPGELVRGQSLASQPQGFGTHASLMLALPQANVGGPVPVADLTSGELEHASKMLSLPQAFGGMSGMGQAGKVCARCGKANCPCGCAGDWRRCTCPAVPVSDLVPGEYTTGATLVDQAQGFGGLGAGAPVPRSDFVPGEILPARRLTSRRQSFGGMGSSLRLPNGQPGRYHGQYGVPISDLKRGEYERAAALIAHRQDFVNGMGDFLPWRPGSPEPSATQGTWLSPTQVPQADLESAASIVAEPQNFKGLGADAAQGTWLAPDQVARSQRGTDASLVDYPQSFSLGPMHGMGAVPPGHPVPLRDFVPGEIEHASKMLSMPQAVNGMGATGDNVRVGKLNLSPICDPVTGECINYATPQEIEAAIGAKIGGQSALVNAKAQLPAFYHHPQLGPWGVDPATAYQYWWAQQAALQQSATGGSPLTIWGSPGMVKPTPPLGPSPLAQTAAFDPYSDTYPAAGAAVERF